jgi:CheY-like chemotaxis protein
MTGPSRILVVDDEAVVRELYRDILSEIPNREILDEGTALFGGQDPEAKPNDQDRYDLTLVERGSDAIRAVQEAVKEGRHFAVAFIDFYMPGIDGMETARQIRKEDPNIKVVMASAFTEYELEELTDEIDMQDIDWLQKPFSIKDVKGLAHTLAAQWISERGSPEQKS